FSLGKQNEILPFTELIGRLPTNGQEWYSVSDVPGDGTVSAASAAGAFTEGPQLHLIPITQAAAGTDHAIGHSELTQDVYSQQQLPKALAGYEPAASAISTDQLRSRAAGAVDLVRFGVINPIAYGGALFQRGKELVADAEARVHNALNLTLPLINKSVNELLAGIGFDPISAFHDLASGAINDIVNQLVNGAHDTLDDVRARLTQLSADL